MKNSNGLVVETVADGHSTSTINGHGKKDQFRLKSTDDSREAARRKNDDNGFEGGYMAAKKAKLDIQFNGPNKSLTNGLGMFHGLSICINGYTDPPEPQLREMFILHGGIFCPYNSSKINFVVATNLSLPSKNLYAAKTIKPEWITESIAAGTKLDHRKYMLYDLNDEKRQPTLTQFMDPNTKSVSKNICEAINKQNGNAKGTDAISSNNGHIGISKSNGLNTNGVDHLPSNERGLFEDPTDFLDSDDDLQTNHLNKAVPRRVYENNIAQKNGRKKIKMATENGFLEDFFQNSRLHLISDQKKEMLNKIGQLRKDPSVHKLSNLEAFKKEFRDGLLKSDSSDNFSFDESTNAVILMHIDLDCFFVSVGLLTRPHLRGKPTVVTHSTGRGEHSNSDIASASYEARKFGIRNGMWVSGAKELCPSLEVIPYNFEEYRRISELFLDTVASMTLDIEPCSVDEMVVNVTSILNQVPGSTPIQLAEFIRRKVFEAIKCPASVGIGSNRLMAKLATKKAKPNGSYHLKDSAALNFIENLKVGELPGIGSSHEAKLSELFSVKTCKELLQVPLKDLKKHFGDKTAEKMIQSCHGKDTADLKFGFDRPKSISVDVNYGIRFSKEDEIADFMIKLCQELASRAVKAQATSSHLSVRILARKKGAGDPKKHGGHGIVDTINKSGKFLHPTRSWQDIFKVSTRLLKLMALPPADYRGIGLSLTDLNFDFDKSVDQKNSVQTTLFDMTTSRGKKMVEFAMKAVDTKDNNIEWDQSESHIENGRDTSCVNHSTSQPEESTDWKIDENSNFKMDASSLKPKSKTNVGVQVQVPVSPNEGQDKVDINVLRELPRDIAREMALHYGINVSELDEDMDWLEGEELLRDTAMPMLFNEAYEHNDKSFSTTEETIESVIRQSAAENPNKAVNPYENVDKIDPSFLSALPDSIRNEVLLQFQEAKGRIDEKLLPSDNEPQPCSSKQALERDRALNNLNTNKKPIQSANPCYKVPIEEISHTINDDNLQEPPDMNLSCDEDMCQEEGLIVPVTPPRSYASTKTASPQNTIDQREDSFSKSSKKRLNFDENQHCALDLNEFWNGSSKPIIPPVSGGELPALNGNTKIEDVRNQIRDALVATSEPVDEDADCLRKYFDELISRGWLNQSRVLLRFIHRKSTELPEESGWEKVLTDIINTTQRTSRRMFGHIICLD